jgi:hypothetical protein
MHTVERAPKLKMQCQPPAGDYSKCSPANDGRFTPMSLRGMLTGFGNMRVFLKRTIVVELARRLERCKDLRSSYDRV